METAIVIDIETRNDGFSPKRDNKEILSCQIGDYKNQIVFHKNSKSNRFNELKAEIEKLIENNATFIGYNIEFDLKNLREFLGINIPRSMCIDIMSMEKFSVFKRFGNYPYIKLEQACKYFGIDVSHKELMDKFGENLIPKNPHWKNDAINYLKANGWLVSEEEIAKLVKRKAFGVAVSISYDDFAKKEDETSLFYRYAIGDVISEFKLFKKLKETGAVK